MVPLSASQISYLLTNKNALIDPTSKSVGQVAVLGDQTQLADQYSATKWFTGSPQMAPTVSKVNFYNLSIPKVGIQSARIEINGDDLKNGAVQYPGTAVPGTYGNTVIFGHSTSPYLFKPNDPVSIFNPLLKVKIGDEIIVNYDGVTYRYVVRHTAEVEPDKIEVLAQRYDKYELTLVTCTPLGTYLRRFVVRAELVN